MNYLQFLQEDDAVQNVYMIVDGKEESTFQEDNILNKIQEVDYDISKALYIMDDLYLTVQKEPSWYLISKNGGCRIIKKESTLVLGIYDKQFNNTTRFRRRMSLLNNIL